LGGEELIHGVKSFRKEKRMEGKMHRVLFFKFQA